jgi:hypothetical protein
MGHELTVGGMFLAVSANGLMEIANVPTDTAEERPI